MASNHEVKSMLETQVASLQRTFAELGLKVDRVEVTLASSTMNFDASGQMAQQQQMGQTPDRQRQASSGLIPNSGYGQWLGEEEPEAASYAAIGDLSAIDYVA
jgi:hypothetical protein